MNAYSFSDDEDDDVGTSGAGIGVQSSTPPRVPPAGGPSSLTADSQPSMMTDFTPPHRRQRTVDMESEIGDDLTAASSTTPRLPAIVRLQKVWVAERACPDLLAWSGSTSGSGMSSTQWRCEEIVDEVCAQIDQQVSILNLLSADETTSEEEHLRLSLVQLDVERARWLLRAYLRTRLFKLEKHSTHYALLPPTHLSTLLSPLERAYLTKYDSLRTSHLQHSVTSYLPESLQSLTDLASPHDYNPNEHTPSSIVERPNTQSAPVFIRCLEDCGNIRMDDGEDALLSKDSVHLVAFAKVRSLVSAGRVELM